MTDSYNQSSINFAGRNLSNSPLQFIVGPEDTGAPFQSIQTAIDAAGDRTVESPANVLVLGGQYEEDVSLRRAVPIFGLGGAQILGNVRAELPLSGPPEDNVTLIQNMIILPPSGPAITVTGGDIQSVIMTNLIVDSVGGATAIDLDTTSPGNAILLSASRIGSDGGLCLNQTDGFVLADSCAFNSASSSDRSIDVSGGGQMLTGCRINGDLFAGVAASFLSYSFCSMASGGQPAITTDSFVSLEQCALQTFGPIAVSGTGALSYTDLAFNGSGKTIDPGLAFVIDNGTAYQPFLPGAAAAWAPPIPTTQEEAIDRIAIALSTGVAPGGGIPPF